MLRARRLKLGDVRRVFYLLGEMRELRSDPTSMWRHAVERLCGLVDARQGVAVRFAEMTPKGKTRVEAMQIAGWPDDATLEVWANWGAQTAGNLRLDPTVDAFALRLGPRQAMGRRMGALVDTGDEAFRDGPMYQQWLGPADVRDLMVAGHRTTVDGQCVGYSLPRTKNRRPYTRRDQLRLQLFIEEQQRMYLRGELTPPALPALSPRQQQIVERLAAGRAPKQIALELGLTVNTVRTYIKALYRRLEVSGRDELMAYLLAQR